MKFLQIVSVLVFCLCHCLVTQTHGFKAANAISRQELHLQLNYISCHIITHKICICTQQVITNVHEGTNAIPVSCYLPGAKLKDTRSKTYKL